MSYDLFFLPKSGKVTFTDFSRYFSRRENYTLYETQAFYENKDTSVYFSFDYYKEEEHTEEDETYYPLSFNLNYFRPSFFSLEAEPEIGNLVYELKLSVFDPQTEGMGEGEYIPEKFFSGWKNGNEFAHETFLEKKIHGDISTLPAKTLNNCWEWNFNKDKLQDSIGDKVFVPKIMLFKHNNKAVTSVVWPDAIPCLLPVVDILIINRNIFAPSRFFKKYEDRILVPWEKLLPLIEKYKIKYENNAYDLSYRTVPYEIGHVIKSIRQKHGNEIEKIDILLEEEIVQKYLQKAS